MQKLLTVKTSNDKTSKRQNFQPSKLLMKKLPSVKTSNKKLPSVKTSNEKLPNAKTSN